MEKKKHMLKNFPIFRTHMFWNKTQKKSSLKIRQHYYDVKWDRNGFGSHHQGRFENKCFGKQDSNLTTEVETFLNAYWSSKWNWKNAIFILKSLKISNYNTVFENHRKSLIQHCERKNSGKCKFFIFWAQKSPFLGSQ